jgi:glycosyltransferase involved in cell wall biosynthesis
MKKINLLIELNSFDKGGLEKVVLDSALLFNKEKINVFIVSVKNTGLLASVAKSKGIIVYSLDRFKIPIIKYLYLVYIIFKNNISVSCSHFSYFGYWVYKILGIKNVTFIHNVYAFLDQKRIKQIKFYDKMVDTYISVSKNATRYAVEKLGLNSSKIITVPNGLIIEEHENRKKNIKKIKRSDFEIEENDYVFLNVASYNLHKGHYLMADAMIKILKERKDIKILCIGNTIVDSHVNQYRQYLKEKGLEKNIIMPGHFPNIESFYDISDAFILPSFIEGWSIAMNEAMFYEKPMILTNTGGSNEVIKNNDIGILIENEFGDIINLDSKILDNIGYNKRNFLTSKPLADSMIQFANNRDYWKEAGKLGKKKIIEKYNLKNIVLKYEDIIINLLDKNNDF